MLNQKMVCCVAVAVMLGSGIYLSAQDPFEGPPPNNVTQDPLERPTANNVAVPNRKAVPKEPVVTSDFNRDANWRPASESAFRQYVRNIQWQQIAETPLSKAMNALQNAESEEMKANAKMNLRDALATDYDEKMDQYDEHIEKLENQLEEMRARLSRRRDAKDDMVSLKLKELIAKADGLGWPTGPTNGAVNDFGPVPLASPFGKARQTFFPVQEMQRSDRLPVQPPSVFTDGKFPPVDKRGF